MKVETIEILIVFVIVSIQLWVFSKTYIQIELFRKIIPKISSLKISKVQVPVADIKRLSPKEMLANIEMYRNTNAIFESDLGTDEDFEDSESLTSFQNEVEENFIQTVEINIIESDEKTNYVFDDILFATNNYLIRNRGAASDFNLIKDIVERNTDAVEEDINLSVGIPLYLGLMGTMLGIVIGLFNMPDLGAVLDTKAKDIGLNEGIDSLIGGVKIAMIASFVGLLLTIFNSGWVFKGSRSLVEKRKNDLYTFVQIELLPIINQGLASTLDSLQRNLMRFKDDFSVQLNSLSSTVGKMEGVFIQGNIALEKQKQILDSIDKTKVSEMVRYNVTVLQQLDISVTQFEKFNNYLTNVNLFVENSQQIVYRTNELLARTENFKTIADSIDSKLDQSQQLLEFLSSHFNKLEDHKQFTQNAVADVGHSISETFKELKVHIHSSSEAVTEFTVKELELLKMALSESKTNLSNLEHLATLKTDVSQFKDSSASQGERLKQAVEDLNLNMAKSIAILEEIETYQKSNILASSFKNLFKSKK